MKDQSTGIELKRFRENSSWSISADFHLDNFFADTEWLPRADHFWLGQPLLDDTFTWYEHSSAAYARFAPGKPPNVPGPNGADPLFTPLPWELSGSHAGERFITRQELDWPIQFGAVKFVPYVLGELGHWGEDVNGDALNRVYGQAGVRASLPMWAVNPDIENQLFNVHGLAHKIVFEAEFSMADANRDLNQLPLYDPLDDNSIESARRHFIFSKFGNAANFENVAPQLDERYYALRTGMASWVTAPSSEIADDLMALRLGAEQRWQTKRGPPGNQRIIDWITLDTNITIFPDPNRDNFGSTAGLLDYNLAWHVGDRLTLVSDGMFDFFNLGERTVSVGGFLSRPPRGSLYAGFRIIEGPISSQTLSLSYSYWMSPKWVSSFGTTIDFVQGNIGQNFRITRIGESLLMSAGLTVDAARNNVGVNFAVEPRFLPKGRLGRIGDAQIPPAGAFGLE